MATLIEHYDLALDLQRGQRDLHIDLNQAAMLKHIGVGPCVEDVMGNPRIDADEIAVAVEHIDSGLDTENIGLELHQRLVGKMLGADEPTPCRRRVVASQALTARTICRAAKRAAG